MGVFLVPGALLVLAHLAAAQLTGNVVDYAHEDCTSRLALDVHHNMNRYSFTFNTQQMMGSICVMVISTPIGISYIRNLVTELDYSLLDSEVALSATETEVMPQFNVTSDNIGSLAIPQELTLARCIGPVCATASCYFPFQCMPCIGMCALSVSNWCATFSLCSTVASECFRPCVKACIKYYSCTCPQSMPTLGGCPTIHTLRLEQPLLLGVDALADGAPNINDQIFTWCFPTAQAPLLQVYLKDFLGHTVHCAKFVAKFG